MNTATDFKKLSELLYDEALEYVEMITNVMQNETIYAFAIYCISGWEGIYITIATHESLERLNQRPTEPELEQYNSHNSVNVDEWEYIGLQFEILNPANDLIQEIGDKFSDLEYEDIIDMEGDEVFSLESKLYMDVIIQVVTKLKNSGCFNRPGFDKDLFFGPFFVDPTEDQLSLMKQVSKQINSKYWHEKLKAFCEFHAG